MNACYLTSCKNFTGFARTKIFQDSSFTISNHLHALLANEHFLQHASLTNGLKSPNYTRTRSGAYELGLLDIIIHIKVFQKLSYLAQALWQIVCHRNTAGLLQLCFFFFYCHWSHFANIQSSHSKCQAFLLFGSFIKSKKYWPWQFPKRANWCK